MQSNQNSTMMQNGKTFAAQWGHEKDIRWYEEFDYEFGFEFICLYFCESKKHEAMTIVSSKEFVANEEKYFALALNEEVFIKKEGNTFHLMCTNTNGHIMDQYDEILKPDEDFHRAITADEFRKGLVVAMNGIDKKYANRCK